MSMVRNSARERLAAGELAITEILPTLDRALYRLTLGYQRRASR